MNDESPPPWQSKPKFSRKFGCLFAGIGLPALLLLLLVAIYMIWTARGNRRAAEALAAIRAAGEPVDGDDLNAFYRLPEGTDDVTELWLIPMRAFETPDYGEAYAALPIEDCAIDGKPIPPPGKPWKELEAVEAFLERYADAMSAAHEAAERGGAARYPADFSQGWVAFIDDNVVMQTRAVARMLALEARVRAHRGDWPGAVRSIRDIHRLANSLERYPWLIAQLVRYAMDGIARDTLQALMEADRLPAEELASLQDLLQSIDYAEGLERAVMGERALGVSLFEDPATLADDMANNNQVTAALLQLIPQGDDLAMYVDFMNRQVDATRLQGVDKLRESDNIQDDVNTTLGNLGPVDRIRHMFSGMLLSGVFHTTTAEARNTAGNRAAAAVIAAERFRQKHGQLPKDLAELVPEFLPEVPVDPFSGEPLKFKIEDDEMTVYSVGRNLVDEKGQNDEWTDGPGDADDYPFPRPPEPEE